MSRKEENNRREQRTIHSGEHRSRERGSGGEETGREGGGGRPREGKRREGIIINLSLGVPVSGDPIIASTISVILVLEGKKNVLLKSTRNC